MAHLEARPRVRRAFGVDVGELVQFIYTWGASQRARGEHAAILELTHNTHSGTTIQQEVEEMSEVTLESYEQELREECTEEGLKKGRVEGREEGREEATLSTSRSILIRLLSKKFAPLPGEIAEKIEQADLDTITRALDKVTDLASLDELDL